MNWHEYVASTGKLPEWPYEVNYGKEVVVECDVLVVGGGPAGCRAAPIPARASGTSPTSAAYPGPSRPRNAHCGTHAPAAASRSPRPALWSAGSASPLFIA